MSRKPCPLFASMWRKSEASPETLAKAHTYNLGELGKENTSPEFVRFDEFVGAEPNRVPEWSGELPHLDENDVRQPGDRAITTTPCSCGAPDAWKCWQDFKNYTLLGVERIARTGRGYTVFAQSEAINEQIIAVTAKYVAPRWNEDGFPCEDFRDLASHLALNEVEEMADGTLSTHFLPKAAAVYFRKMGSCTALTEHIAERRNPPTKGKHHV